MNMYQGKRMLKKCLCVIAFCVGCASLASAEGNKSCDCGSFASQEQINKFFGLDTNQSQGDKAKAQKNQRVKIPTH